MSRQPVRGERRRIDGADARPSLPVVTCRGASAGHGGTWTTYAVAARRDSHHVLRRLSALHDEQIRDVTGVRQDDTGFAQSSLHSKLAARLGAQQNLTGWYQRSEQEDVRGYKDLWGGLGRLQSDFDPQRFNSSTRGTKALGVGRLDWVSGTFSVNSQDDGSVRQGLRTTDRIIRDDVGVDAFGYSVQAGTQLDGRHASYSAARSTTNTWTPVETRPIREPARPSRSGRSTRMGPAT